jgi:hypothetical protein
VKALTVRDEHAQLHPLKRMQRLQVEQTLQGIRIAYVQIVAGHEP